MVYYRFAVSRATVRPGWLAECYTSCPSVDVVDVYSSLLAW